MSRIPPAEEIRAGIWSVPVPFVPGVPYSVGYLFQDGTGGIQLVDPGEDTESNRNHVSTVLAMMGSSLDDVTGLVVTHLHRDHIGIATWLSERNEVPLLLHRADLDDIKSGNADGRYVDDPESLAAPFGIPRDELPRLLRTMSGGGPTVVPRHVGIVEDGELMAIGHHRLRAIHTPGHTRGHLCFEVEGERLFLSGDHVLPGFHPGLGRGGPGEANPVADYLESLDRLVDTGQEVAPGHGGRFHGLARRRTQTREHVLRRANEVAAALAADPEASIWQLASRLTWRAGWPGLAGTQLQSALAQTEMYRDYVRRGWC